MGKGRRAGFTIIETLLFLSVTGLLVMSLLVGVGISVNTQRYQDSVNSFKQFLQDQYSDLQNVFNDRSPDWACTNKAITVEGSPSSEARGQSDCILLGKYIAVKDGHIQIASVVGYEKSDEPRNDIDTLKDNYFLGLSEVGSDSKDLEWGTRIAWPLSGPNAQPVGTSRSLAILIIQSPISHSTYTFTSDVASDLEDTSSDDLKAMIVAGGGIPGQSQRTICINSDGLSITGNKAVYIAAYATNASSIETRSNEVIKQLGGTVEC